MNLVGAVIYSGRPFMPVIKSQYGVIGHAKTAVNLKRPVDDLLHHIGHHEFNQRYLLASLFLAFIFDHPGCMKHHQACSLDIRRAFGYPGLDNLLVGQFAVRGDYSVPGPGNHKVEGAVADADPAHTMMDAAGAEPFLGNYESMAFRPE